MRKQSIFIARVLAAISIYFNPLAGFILYMLFDDIDARILKDLGGMNRNEYQKWDKKVDLFGYLIMMITSFRFGLGFLFVPLSLIRAIGVYLFTTRGKEKYLIYFPDFVSFAFIWLIFGKILGVINLIGSFNYWMLLIPWLLVKILHEYVMHKIVPARKERG